MPKPRNSATGASTSCLGAGHLDDHGVGCEVHDATLVELDDLTISLAIAVRRADLDQRQLVLDRRSLVTSWTLSTSISR